MFERYTDAARRTIFFARFEASNTGSAYMEPLHLLLGLLRENQDLNDRLTVQGVSTIREEILRRFPQQPKISTSVDLPLSQEAKRALGWAADEADALNHKNVNQRHLLLGLLRLDQVRELLAPHGIEYAGYREAAANSPPTSSNPEAIGRSRAIEREDEWEQAQAAAALREPLTDLSRLLEQASRHLQPYSAEYERERLKRKSWSRKQALGHLVDWATTHHHWFARALTEPRLAGVGYPLDEWVIAQNYDTAAWPDIVDLWVLLNRLIVHVLSRATEDQSKTPCRIGLAEPVPLSELVQQYVTHCEDVIGQILARLD